jgi:hypothetical protein
VVQTSRFLLPVYALKRLSADHGEIKSMYIVQSMPRQFSFVPDRTHAVQQWAWYSITSSVRASSMGGMVIPSVLAVARLMTSSRLG